MFWRLDVVRDEITNGFYAADTAGLSVRVLYDVDGGSTTVTFEVYRKVNGADTNGVMLYQGETNFVVGRPWKQP